MISRIFLTLALMASAAFANPHSEQARATFLTGWKNPDGTRTAAIRIDLAPGWKTYWRAPGDAGIPPLIDWSASQNLSEAELHWPHPHVFDQNGMRSIGYKRSVVLPVTLTPKRKGKPVKMNARLQIGICKNICVPVELTLAEIDAQPQGTAAIKAALATVPQSSAGAGISALTCTVAPGPEGLALTIAMKAPKLGGREEAAVETGDPLIWAREPKLTRNGGTLMLKTELIHALGSAFAFNRSALRITLLGKSRAVDIQGCG